jgi:hypothetical protein
MRRSTSKNGLPVQAGPNKVHPPPNGVNGAAAPPASTAVLVTVFLLGCVGTALVLNMAGQRFLPAASVVGPPVAPGGVLGVQQGVDVVPGRELATNVQRELTRCDCPHRAPCAMRCCSSPHRRRHSPQPIAAVCWCRGANHRQARRTGSHAVAVASTLAARRQQHHQRAAAVDPQPSRRAAGGAGAAATRPRAPAGGQDGAAA